MCIYLVAVMVCAHPCEKIIATIYLSVVAKFTVTYMCFVLSIFQNIFRGGGGELDNCQQWCTR